MRIKVRPARPAPSVIMSIDPGNTHSAFMLYCRRTRTWTKKGKVPNSVLLAEITLNHPPQVVCETIQPMGMRVGETVFATARFVGRIQERCFGLRIPCELMKRTTVKKELCPGIQRAKDKHVRAALIRIYGEPGTKKAPGKTFGIASDVWSALAIAHTYTVTNAPCF